MFKESDSLSFHKLVDHVAEDSANSIEPLVGVANVCQACLVQEDFLDNKDSNRF